MIYYDVLWVIFLFLAMHCGCNGGAAQAKGDKWGMAANAIGISMCVAGQLIVGIFLVPKP